MSWLDLPPLAALRAFAAFAETGNVVDAGASLNVSHAAISQQLRALERHMDVPLLDRSGRTLRLTPDGQHLADALALGFGAIRTAVQEIAQSGAARALHISATPSFATFWLMPILQDFRAAHPRIDLRIDPSPQLVTLRPGGIDVALRYGDGNWPGLSSEMLVRSPMIVVAAPSLLAGRTIRRPIDLADLPWLEELGTTEANNWLRSHGVAQGMVGGTVQLPGNLLLASARDGHGVAVTVRCFVEPDLQAGRLVALFEEDPDKGYHIVTLPGVLRPELRQFIAWLRRQKRAGV
ncbi:LysR family transcriptional regulator [Thalassococcus sp. S3]|uniref:LysR family transcriptional regulator n=1 Tax=Thalassococcus sp. S3 TaxID=2017482 RepID=UPI0010248F9D|nr:LysR family transcriptional regulator [Thalassococcus sp. S3]QBF30330.1 LysR family transcriptional regulator [Thalassococcus sp. S3]